MLIVTDYALDVFVRAVLYWQLHMLKDYGLAIHKTRYAKHVVLGTWLQDETAADAVQ